MPRTAIITMVVLVLLAVMAGLLHREFSAATDRPAVQRQHQRAVLESFRSALITYRQRYQDRWPPNAETLFADIESAPTAYADLDYRIEQTTERLIKGAGLLRYRVPAVEAGDDTIVVAGTRHHRAVAAGEPWGGKDEVAEEDVPGVALVLTVALDGVRELAPADFYRRWPEANQDLAP